MTEEKAPPATRGADERRQLIKRAGIVGLGTLASRLLGLVRDVVLAALFRRDETDAFFVAFTIPNALRQLLGEGAVASAVVPILTGTLETDGDEAARGFFARARGASLLALTVVTALGMIFARPLTELFADGYHARPEEFERTVSLTRWVFPYIFFMGTAALGAAALNAKRAFGVAAFAPGLLNVAWLIAAVTLPPILLAHGIDRAQALTIGVLAGGVLQVVAQWPALRRIGYLARPRFDLRDPRVREMGRRIAPMAFGIGVYYVDLTLSRRFLSELEPGAQSYFTWAMRLCDFPQGIFVMALSTAALPSLSALAARGERGELAETYAHGLKLALFVALPASTLLAACAHPIVVALFQRGQFGPLASDETARALLWQGAAIWTVSVVRQTVPVFYALGDSKTPVWISALDLLAFIAPRARPARIARSRRHQHRRRRIERGADGAARRRPPPPSPRAAWPGGAPSAPVGRAHHVRVAGGRRLRVGRRHPRRAYRRVTGPFERLLPATAAGAAFLVSFVLAAHLVGSSELRELGQGGRSPPRQASRPRTWYGPLKMKPEDLRITEAEFAAGAINVKGLPAPMLAELAFAGRSNAGKSSVMNTLVQRKSLVRTSSTPGCTRQLNVLQGRSQDRALARSRRPPRLRLRQAVEEGEVDLGRHDRIVHPDARHLARGGPHRRRPPRVSKTTTASSSSSSSLRVPAEAIAPLRAFVVATKLDKLPLNQQKPRLFALKNEMKKAGIGGAPIGFSAVTGEGRDILWGKLLAAVDGNQDVAPIQMQAAPAEA